jgi:diphthine-ammonia ligase
VAFLRIKNAKLEFKYVDSDFYIHMPQRIEDGFLQIIDAVQVSERLEAKKVPMTPFSVNFSVNPMYPVTSKKLDPWVFVSNVQAETDKGIPVEEEVVRCFSILKGKPSSDVI